MPIANEFNPDLVRAVQTRLISPIGLCFCWLRRGRRPFQRPGRSPRDTSRLRHDDSPRHPTCPGPRHHGARRRLRTCSPRELCNSMFRPVAFCVETGREGNEGGIEEFETLSDCAGEFGEGVGCSEGLLAVFERESE